MHINLVDLVQMRFLRNGNFTFFEAPHHLNLASLCCRRDITNLGIIFRHQLRYLFRLAVIFFVPGASHRYFVIDTTRVLRAIVLTAALLATLLCSIYYQNVLFIVRITLFSSSESIAFS